MTEKSTTTTVEAAWRQLPDDLRAAIIADRLAQLVFDVPLAITRTALAPLLTRIDTSDRTPPLLAGKR